MAALVVLSPGCGDLPTLPVPTEPGFMVAVSIPGLADTTVQGDSLYWRIFHRPVPIGTPAAKDLILELLGLDPPPPLASHSCSSCAGLG